jgi:transposase-like protein
MLGTSRHKAWLDLPRLLAKELEPEQLCLLIATIDLADIADDNKLVDVTIYQAWLRQMQVRLHNTPLPREPLGVVPQPEPSEPTDEELRARQVKRNRLVSLWEEREERRRYTNLV